MVAFPGDYSPRWGDRTLRLLGSAPLLPKASFMAPLFRRFHARPRRSREAARRRERASDLKLESLEPRLVMDGYAALTRPTELQYWDSTKADNGYNFYGVGGTSYLLDMEGRVVHSWPLGTNPRLLTNGNILDATSGDVSGFTTLNEVDTRYRR